jgi:protein-tyrosine phosphatase
VYSKNTNIKNDLDLLKSNKINIIVSLISFYELKKLNMENLFFLIRTYGFEHIHFPIIDRSIPKEEIEFKKLICHLERKIIDNHVVHIHCNAGLGRSGLLAAILCKSLKVSSEPIKYVRKFRKGAIETEEQENFIHRL